jgi:hypothetical protein
MRIATAVRNAAADASVDLVDVGAGTAVLEVYSGSAPATIGDAPAGDLLVSFDLADPAFGAAAAGVATVLGVPIAAVGVGDDTASYGRFLDKDGNALYDTEDIGTSGNTITMSTTTVSTGLDVDLNSATITMPGGSV